MAVPTPMTFASGNQASAAFNDGINLPLTFLMSTGPCCIARIAAPIDLTPEAFTPLSFDTTVFDNGMLVGGTPAAFEPGIYIAGASIRTNSVRGNKELRIAHNAGFDDADPWLATINQFGVATAAFSSLAACGFADMAASDSIDVGVYSDSPEAAQVLNGIVWAAWIRNT